MAILKVISSILEVNFKPLRLTPPRVHLGTGSVNSVRRSQDAKERAQKCLLFRNSRHKKKQKQGQENCTDSEKLRRRYKTTDSGVVALLVQKGPLGRAYGQETEHVKIEHVSGGANYHCTQKDYRINSKTISVR